jgi:hypothetical protein
VARSFCVAKCESNGDCRAGYVCADPRTQPWNALILDNDQTKHGCIPVPPAGSTPDASAPVSIEVPVCSATAPPAAPIDAGAPQISDAGAQPPPLFPPTVDAGTVDAGL